MYEFHVSRQARDRYQFDLAPFQFNGNVIFADFHAARVFAQKMNAQRDLVNFPEQAVRASDLNAMGLIDEMLHLTLEQYRQQHNPHLMADALRWLEGEIGAEAVDRAIRQFTAEFPPVAVYRGEIDVDTYLNGSTNSRSHREIALEEMLLNWLSNHNPAFQVFGELFDDAPLEQTTSYPRLITGVQTFFDAQPSYGEENPAAPKNGRAGADASSLLELLRAPARVAPYSLTEQLEFLRRRQTLSLETASFRILSSLDLIREETKAVFHGPGPALIPTFQPSALQEEPEKFSPDLAWMPRLVMIAKNAYVWLDQLSRRYGRTITRLDHIPDEELDTLARAGFTGLWLIGIWERSPASQRIKQLTGNPEALASAYSLYDYIIAAELGGEEAYFNLNERARARGIRLAADMVPNHTGIVSKWVTEHPDWFVSLPVSPYPNYTFTGPNLSEDPHLGIFLEDHYYTRTDAAVVFKRVDYQTGRVDYIYHGNDGTSMPWNDTAQLNYLNPVVREAVIQKILDVARKFSVIRFDAAMTLAKKHIARLWYPEPGTGGAVPSRAGLGRTRAEFDAAMPEEFWREVVDRVALEVPETLLLAEAFWLMEGYFVRTLGMHRVYNSAFMHMLRDEKNAEYRAVIKNTIEFDPEILRRYVNFMNNPDEETAVAQFGKDGKYFGVCTLMCTLPGLPMFGHGQIEGLKEKYGMEYKRAYYDESADGALIARHEREIFPLLHRRRLFAGVENFLLYDFYGDNGLVNEDVFAYSNREGTEGSLVVYQNKWGEAHGWIKTSSAYAVKGEGEEKRLEHRTLAEGLGLTYAADHFVIFREHISGLEYIRNSQEIHEKGMSFDLGAFEYRVYLDFREVHDPFGEYAALADYLHGRGVASVEEARKEIFLRSILQPFRTLVSPEMVRGIRASQSERKKGDSGTEEQEENELMNNVQPQVYALLTAAKEITQGTGAVDALTKDVLTTLQAVRELPNLTTRFPKARSKKYQAAQAILQKTLGEDTVAWAMILAWTFTHGLGKVMGNEIGEKELVKSKATSQKAKKKNEVKFAALSRSWIDEWLLGKILSNTLQNLGADQPTTWRAVPLFKLLVSRQGQWFALEAKKPEQAYATLQAWLRDAEAQQYLGVNRFQGVLWYNKETFTKLLNWMFTLSVVEITTTLKPEKVPQAVLKVYRLVEALQEADEVSGYQVEALLEAVKP
ncbi:MAG: alpha-amylase family glycosyl hydrolase [Anaerolineales bacterium]